MMFSSVRSAADESAGLSRASKGTGRQRTTERHGHTRMATLEVHDGQGRVQFVELARDHPVLFGTSAACDVLLEGEWRSGRCTAGSAGSSGGSRSRLARRRICGDQRPKMTTGSIHQGDEITVGDCRMFLLRR